MRLLQPFLLVLLFWIGNCTLLNAQARIILNDNIQMTMNNGVYLVVGNGNSNAISTAGTGGNIISEDEFNIVKWLVGTNTGNYTVPFTSATGVKIPLDMIITTAGTGMGFVEFSTYPGGTWDNETYMPAIVTNMTNSGIINNSAEVIDRFWGIATNGYTTRPSGTFNFSYRDAEHTAVGNTITESELKAERYYTPTNNWDFYAPTGIDDAVANKVNGAVYSDANFYPVWTLIDQTAHPLPISLLDYTIACAENSVKLEWSTASETGALAYTVLSSNDGNLFYPVAQITAAGDATNTQYYDLFIPNGGGNYYQLLLTNTDLSVEHLGVVYGDCPNMVEPVFYVYGQAPHQVNVVAQNLPDGEYALSLVHLSGELCYTENVFVANGSLTAEYVNPKLATGIYLVVLSNRNGLQLVEKVVVRD